MKLKVVAVSSNTNSFGLRQMLLFSEDGKAYKACANSLNFRSKGFVLELPTNDPSMTTEDHLVRMSFELVERLHPDPPKKIVAVEFVNDRL